MVRAHPVHGDAADHHHVLAQVGKAFAQRLARVDLIAAQKAPFPQLAHALCGAPGMHRIRRNTAGQQQIRHRLLERRRVELADARNAQMAGLGGGAIVIAAIVHGRSDKRMANWRSCRRRKRSCEDNAPSKARNMSHWVSQTSPWVARKATASSPEPIATHHSIIS